MFTRLSHFCVGPTFLKAGDKTAGIKLRHIHNVAIAIDVIVGLGLIALAMSAGHLGIHSNIKYTLLGVGVTYSAFGLIHLAWHAKLQLCPNKYLLVNSRTEQVGLEYVDKYCC